MLVEEFRRGGVPVLSEIEVSQVMVVVGWFE